MKKIYLLSLVIVALTMQTFGQMPLAWNVMLPADYATAPPVRENLIVEEVDDDDITSADNLTAIWDGIDVSHIYDVDNITSGTGGTMPAQTPEEFTGKFALLAGEESLYVIFNITDANVDSENDGCEIVVAGNSQAYNINPEIMLEDKTIWNWINGNEEKTKYNAQGGLHDFALVHDMARYGLWSDAGAVKLGTIPTATDGELHAGTMSFNSVINNYNTFTGNPGFGSTNAATPTIVDVRTGGYLQLVIIPWTVMNDNKLEETGDQMSIAVQVKNYAGTNAAGGDSTYVYWGGSQSNEAYWAPVFYGAIATLGELVEATGLALNPATLSVAKLASAQISAVFTPATTSDKAIVWTSSDEGVATVDISGIVTAVEEGTATITGTSNDGGFEATCAVTVTANVPVTGVSLDHPTLSITHGSQAQLTQTIAPDDASLKTVKWTSSDETKVTVNPGGFLTAKFVGSATIIVTTDDGDFTAECIVTVDTLHVTGMSLDKETASIAILDSIELKTTFEPAGATDQSVEWTSSDEDIATVDADGKVKAVAAGTATITAISNDGDFEATCVITVLAEVVKVTGISLDKSTLSIEKDATSTLTAIITPDDATDKKIAWTSSDEGIATVDASGVVTAIAKGSAIISVETNDGGFKATCAVSVTEPISAISNILNLDISIYVSNNELVIPASELSQISIYNITGANIMSVNNPSGNINVAGLNKGLYIARVQTYDGKRASIKFIK